MDDPKAAFLTTHKASKVLGVSLRTVQLWVETGILKAWKTEGGHRRILMSSVDELLSKRTLQIGQPVGEKPFTIVIVEDDPQLRKLYQRHINSWKLPLQIIMASNGYEGLLLIGQEKPDLVIADLMMPGMNGFQMIQALRDNPELKATDIVVVTALDDEGISREGFKPEGLTIIQKPVSFEEIQQLIKKRLNESVSQ